MISVHHDAEKTHHVLERVKENITVGKLFLDVANSNWNFEFDAASNCSFVGFNIIMLTTYNHSVYQRLAKDLTNYISLTYKTYAINLFCM